MSGLYVGCCPDHIDFPDLADNADLPSWVDDLIKQIYGDKGLPEDWDNESARHFIDELWQGIREGYGSDISTVDYESPDFEMLANLQRDIVHFSSAKDYQMQRAMINELIDEEGKLRSFVQFRNAAYQVADLHTHSWLRAEYDLSVASAQMAGKWVDIQKNKKLLPYLEYDAIIDGRTSKICISLNGVLLPADDPFWNQYYPPNHFNCRSTVKQQHSGTVTKHGDIVYPDNVPAIFKVNLAKQGLAYPEGHAYYKDYPAKGELGLLRKETQDNTRAKYVGKEIKLDQIGAVKISWQGIKEIANNPHSDKEKQLQLMQVLPQLMNNAEYIRSAIDETGKAKMYHYYNVRGLGKNMILVIRENWAGEKVVYSIVDHIK